MGLAGIVAAAAGACTSNNGDDDDASAGSPSAGSGGKGSGGKGSVQPSDGGTSPGGVATGNAGANAAGMSPTGGAGGKPMMPGAGGDVMEPAAGGGAAGAAGSAGAGNGACQADLQGDPENCGACGRSCGGGECSSGDCAPSIILNPKDDARTDPHPVFMLTATSVFEWQYVDDQTFVDPAPEFRSRLVTGALDVQVPPAPVGSLLMDLPVPAGGDDYPRSASFDAAHLYEATYTQVLGKSLTSNAAAAKVFSLPANVDCENLVVTPTAFYLSEHSRNGNSTPQALYTIANPPPSAAATPSAITGLGGRDQINDLLVVGANLFWIEYNLADSAQMVVTAPVAGLSGNVQPVVLDPQVYTTEASLASDGQYLYWTVHVEPAGKVRRVKLTTLSADLAEDVSDEFDSPIEGIALDADYAYFADRHGVLFRAKKDGSAGNEAIADTSILNPDQVALRAGRVIGVDSRFVYFALNDGPFGRAVGRLPKTPAP